MTTHETDAQPRDLARPAGDVAALLEQRIAAARPVPDFADMLQRARELAPERVSEADLARAAALPAVIPPGHDEGEDAAALAPFAAALRAELDAKIAERRMASIPPVPLPRRGRGRVGLVLGLAVALAAAVILVLVRPTQGVRQGPGGGAQANDQGLGQIRGAARNAAPGAVEDRVDPPASEVVIVAPVPQDSPVPTPTAAVVVPQPVLPDSSEAPRTRTRTRPAAPQPGPSLEDEAQALWERGELAAAEQKLRQVVTLAGRSARAELAYGDLFALVRQLRGADGQGEVWREYLERFPAGRFAEDVRAGLCLRAAADRRGECWRDYLERHPQGTHRAQAESAVAEDAP